MRHKTEYRVGIGASSLLMIFVTLALAALGLLSLYAAKNNAALCRRSVDMTVAFYEAAADVQRSLAAIDESRTVDMFTWHAALAAYQDSWTGIPLKITLNDDATFDITVDAGAGRTLSVEGSAGTSIDPTITLTRHELLAAPTATDDSPLPVFMP